MVIEVGALGWTPTSAQACSLAWSRTDPCGYGSVTRAGGFNLVRSGLGSWRYLKAGDVRGLSRRVMLRLPRLGSLLLFLRLLVPRPLHSVIRVFFFPGGRGTVSVPFPGVERKVLHN